MLATRDQQNGSFRAVFSPNGGQRVRFCGFTENVCPFYFFPSTATDNDLSQRALGRAYSGSSLWSMLTSHYLHAGQFHDHQRHHFPTRQWIGLCCVFLLRLQGHQQTKPPRLTPLSRYATFCSVRSLLRYTLPPSSRTRQRCT